MQKTRWKEVAGYEGLYKISDTGNIISLDKYINGKSGCKSFRKERPMKNSIDKYGYAYCELTDINGVRVKKKIHRLVASTFIRQPEVNEQVNHIDGNKLNNYVLNLEWCTASHNRKHAFRIGLSTFSTEKAKCAARFSALKNSRPVNVYTMDDKFIETFKSIKEAKAVYGGNICSVLVGKCTHAKGFVFRYCNSHYHEEKEKLQAFKLQRNK